MSPVVTVFLGWVKSLKLSTLNKNSPGQNAQLTALCDPRILNSRVRLISRGTEDCAQDIFSMEICGTIHAPSDTHSITVQVSIVDQTQPVIKHVEAKIKKWQEKDSSIFCYKADLGRLSGKDTTVSDWMAVAKIEVDWLILPRKGQRNLRFNTSIFSAETGDEIAHAVCSFIYENTASGYLDLAENINRTKTLAVVLGFAVSAADGKLFNCEVEVIKNWARENIGNPCDKTGRKLEKALKKTMAFFRDGNQVDTYKICKEIAEISPLVNRYDILNLCLNVVLANDSVTAEEQAILKNLAKWLEVDMERFRAMAEKVLPIGTYKIKDMEFALGVTVDMSQAQVNKQLNHEYQKWNARVTNSNPAVRVQADHMLNFIAEARSKQTC